MEDQEGKNACQGPEMEPLFAHGAGGKYFGNNELFIWKQIRNSSFGIYLNAITNDFHNLFILLTVFFDF